jgi:ATP-dependent DNA helicase RecQ
MEKLKEIFGFDSFKPGQKEVINKLLSGQSALAVFPTGSGKSLCFQYPAVMFKNLTIVVSPLIALMKDQVEFLKSRNIPAARLDSTLSWEEVKQIYADLRSNKIRILYAAPERLSNERFTHVLEALTIDLMVIDEAHCISEWGHNFRPDYMKLAILAEKLNAGSVLTLTATATPSVVADICREFKIKPENYVNTGFYRPNLELRFIPCANSAKTEILISELKKNAPVPTIVYVTLQKTAETVAEALRNSQIDADAYHAGMGDEKRHAVQDKFMNSSSSVVVATIAFGMGIDKSDIRRVFHYNLPKSIENYSQEIGRAGRDGKPAVCTMFADLADMTTLQNFTYGDTPEKNSIEKLTEELLGQNTTFDISYYELSEKFDIRELVLKTYFTYLELLGILTHIAPYYSEYKVQFSLPEDKIYEAFDQTRSAFLKKVFMSGKKGRTWLTINIKDCSEQLNEDRVRIVRALNYLEENGFIILKVSGVRQVYRLNSAAATVDSGDLINKLQELFAKREERDIAMSSNIIRLLEHRGCKVRFILNFFGENFKRDCGHCEWCITRNDTTPVSSPKYHLTESDKLSIAHLQSQFPSLLGTNRKITRFLCGISSPRTSRTRIACITPEAGGRKQPLTRHKDFGKFSQVPFRELLSILESC